MFRLRVNELAQQRGIANLYSILKQHGFTDYKIRKYQNEHLQIVNLSDLKKLCMLLKCDLNTLIKWMPKDDAELERYGFLMGMYHEKKVMQLNKKLQGLTHEQLVRLEQVIEGIEGDG